MTTPEGQPARVSPYKGTIREIVPTYRIGADGDFPIAKIDKENGGQSWLPLPEDSGLKEGDIVQVIPETTYARTGSGSSTTYRVDKDSPK